MNGVLPQAPMHTRSLAKIKPRSATTTASKPAQALQVDGAVVFEPHRKKIHQQDGPDGSQLDLTGGVVTSEDAAARGSGKFGNRGSWGGVMRGDASSGCGVELSKASCDGGEVIRASPIDAAGAAMGTGDAGGRCGGGPFTASTTTSSRETKGTITYVSSSVALLSIVDLANGDDGETGNELMHGRSTPPATAAAAAPQPAAAAVEPSLAAGEPGGLLPQSAAGAAAGRFLQPSPQPEGAAAAGPGLPPPPPLKPPPAAAVGVPPPAAAAAAPGTTGEVVPLQVAEQRVSPLLQSLFVAVCLGLTPAIQAIPTGVLWGYFAFMAVESLPGSQLWERLLLLVTDSRGRGKVLQQEHAAYLQVGAGGGGIGLIFT